MHPKLNPSAYFPDTYNAQTGEEAVQFALQEIEQNGCYDPDKMGFDLFEAIQDSLIISPSEETDARNELKSLLKEMTNGDPTKRPDIDTVISRLNDIFLKLQPPQPNVVI